MLGVFKDSVGTNGRGAERNRLGREGFERRTKILGFSWDLLTISKIQNQSSLMKPLVDQYFYAKYVLISHCDFACLTVPHNLKLFHVLGKNKS